LPLTPVLILKATLGQKPKNQPLSSLIILKKSPAIIVTGNTKGRVNRAPGQAREHPRESAMI
jgi:hypothetical protein